MRKAERHELIRRLVRSQTFERQDQLVSAIEEKAGKKITQATISRDLKEMHLVKVRLKDGGFAYQYSLNDFSIDETRLSRLLKRNIESLAIQDTLVMIKVVPGTGEVIGNLLEAMEFEEVFGVLVNDAKIMLFIKDDFNGQELAVKIRELL
ncbi:transcriptional regulator of arginine metabolism [Weissella beninensis]|uniref:Arginine repressor n=1 Tax=Periweissella beninensis TaxID=504936 RepID=A0ABT0VHW8_9LACO|nr:ArgR family transcriptional regulator [Periweissella beninensis]MBM7544014.1 transcriptional regulator of arginine metabolism [Periweissella beninensis]MCM2437428.1 ArgR family transcriptional regulator [Periweissella beninensis]